MIDLSRLDCPVLSILRRQAGIPKQEPAEKEKKPGVKFTVQNASDQFQLPKETAGQQVLRHYGWGF